MWVKRSLLRASICLFLAGVLSVSGFGAIAFAAEDSGESVATNPREGVFFAAGSDDAVNQAKTRLDQAIANVAAVSKAKDEAYSEMQLAQDAFADASALVGSRVLSLKTFFKDENSEYALLQFTRSDKGQVLTEVNEATHSGKTGDATDYRNVFSALDTLGDLNGVRASLGLTQLQVSDELMARETVSTNWSAFTVGHSKNCGAENLAYGYDDPMSGWYNYEKTIWDAAAESNQYNGTTLPDGWQTMSAAQLHSKVPDFYGAVGHYLNVINKSYEYCGAACNNVSGACASVIYGQSYRSYANDTAYSVADWRARFQTWVNSKLNTVEDPAFVDRQAADAAKAHLEVVQEDYRQATVKLDEAKEAQSKAQADYDAAVREANKTVEVTSVVLSASVKEVMVGSSPFVLTATVLPSNATDKTVTWSSSNPEIASVTQMGVVTPKSAGAATVTVRAGSLQAQCAVAVVAAGEPEVPVVPAGRTGWIQDADGWHYYDGSGIALTGWQQVGGKTFYLGDDGTMRTGWTQVDGRWYYLRPGNGDMATGWVQVGGKWFYTGHDGAMCTGWTQVDGKWYYLRPGNGDMATGWFAIGGKYFYTGNDGVMRTGWTQVGDKWYYLRPGNGDMVTGWIQISVKWYYLRPGNGDMATGWVQVGGKWYYLNPKNGDMLTNQWIGGAYWVDEDGVMATNAWVDNGRYYVNGSGIWIPGYTGGSIPNETATYAAGSDVYHIYNCRSASRIKNPITTTVEKARAMGLVLCENCRNMYE